MGDVIPSEGEIVLIYHHDQPSIFARIELIEPDIKKGWYQITLLLLTIPTQIVTWILRGSYIKGEPFTMSGNPMRLEAVKRVDIKRELEGPIEPKEKEVPGKHGKVIPFVRP
ncbi:MAG TPA: hypothetical protein DDW42_09515 [Desulfobacteraceae bacterium]|nr:hypothetical protein [Desulfobacteraceae bacterium]